MGNKDCLAVTSASRAIFLFQLTNLAAHIKRVKLTFNSYKPSTRKQYVLNSVFHVAPQLLELEVKPLLLYFCSSPARNHYSNDSPFHTFIKRIGFQDTYTLTAPCVRIPWKALYLFHMVQRYSHFGSVTRHQLLL